MSKKLMIPIHLDALFVGGNEMVVEPFINYDRLPFSTTEHDENPSIPFLGLKANAQAFQDINFSLQAGIHLHWSLPDALTKGINADNDVFYPKLPSRWLIARRGGGLAEKKWIIESNYLYPKGTTHLSGSVAIPFKVSGQLPNEASFRYLGRKMLYQAWNANDSSGTYYDNLTAIAYGDPNFTSFYPNCHSVFGFYDREVKFRNLQSLSYELFGWYQESAHDYLASFFQQYVGDYQKTEGKFPAKEELEQKLTDVFKWKLPENYQLIINKADIPGNAILQNKVWSTLKSSGWFEGGNNNKGILASFETRVASPLKDSSISELVDDLLRQKASEEFPKETLCFSTINFEPPAGLNAIENPNRKSQDVHIAIGNTGTEALSAFLAKKINSGASNEELEDQLEAIQLNSKLQQHILDIGAKFKETRHNNSFNAFSGGTLWTLRKESDTHTASQAENIDAHQKIDYPLDLDQDLDQLNALQKKHNKAIDELLSLRQQLFADWCRYLQSCYPEEFVDNPLPSPEEIKHFIEAKSLKIVQERAFETVPLILKKNRGGRIVEAAPENRAPAKNTVLLADLINKIIAKLKAYNDSHHLIANYKLEAKSISELVVDHTDNEYDAKAFGNMQWIKDDRFISCPEFDGKDDYLKIEIPSSQPIKAISFWAYIPSKNQGNRICLLDARPSLANGLISNQNIGNDWTKFFINGEEVNSFLWDKLIFNQWFHFYVEAKEAFVGHLSLMTNSSKNEFLKGRLAHLHILGESLTPENIKLDKAQYTPPIFSLREMPAPRYWQPKEPVALIAGNIAKPSLRHGADGRLQEDGFLECEVFENSSTTHFNDDLIAQIQEKIRAIQSAKPDHFGFGKWRHQPWHPLLMEWEVDMFPIRHKSNMGSEHRKFHNDFITDNYGMKENETELDLKKDKLSIVNVLSVYQGRSILTPFSKKYVKKKTEKYLTRVLTADFLADQSNKDTTEPTVSQLIDWYKKPTVEPNQQIKTPILNIIQGYENYTNNPDFYCLSQALGGFNEALLTRQLIMQTEIADPIGFTDNQTFASRIKTVIGTRNKLSAEVNNDFSPIRSGVLQLNKLRLIDNFGRYQDLQGDELIVPKHLKAPNSPNMVFLPPRIVQAARINFRWLAAKKAIEMNIHPDSCPICGWFLPNNLDNSLMVYDDSGKALCSIALSSDSDEILQLSPGLDFPEGISDRSAYILNQFENIHLKKLVQFLMVRQIYSIGKLDPTSDDFDLKDSFLYHFISAVDTALANINPESFAQHQDLALLMGRPIAVVRSSLSLELKKPPAVDNDALALHQDIHRNTRETEGFTQIKIPIRIGEYQQLNDGLVGYWIEEKEGFRGNMYYAPQSDEVVEDFINTRSEQRFNLFQAIAEAPKELTMLVDPRGKVHATSGILPTKDISIPAYHFEKALKNMAVTFLTSPLLTDAGKIRLPLVEEAGFQWSWIAKEQEMWRTVPAEGVLQQNMVLAHFADSSIDGDLIWQRLVSKGWITELEGNLTAKIVPASERKEKDLGDDLEAYLNDILQILESSALGPIDTQANFHGKQVIREGWLQLKQIQ